MICLKCKTDHKIKKKGELSICENEEYKAHGSTEGGYGVGKDRYQHTEAK